ncbi:unnamed protein product [Cladocopium goreaui]|uniref:Uncharacterized protein n=1 Tax=Cladocopium goreaui TaxID=2562237 RepID=A0A9P1BQT7_9DINO|nr:unnamed protein product [Cladocopium goreaui]
MGVLRPVLEPFFWALFSVTALEPLSRFFECMLLAATRPTLSIKRPHCLTMPYVTVHGKPAENQPNTAVPREHEVELQDLRAENQRLNEELRRLRGEVQHEVPHHSLPYSATDLRMAAAHPEPDPPHVASAATLIHGDNQNPLVEVVIHGAGGLPEALLQAADGSTCQLCTTFGFEDAKSGWLPLQRDAWMSAPNMVGASEQTWEAVLTRPCRLCLQVASTFLSDDELFVELHLPGRKVALACASVKLGSQRQKWAFDRGGFLDAEVLVNGAHSVPKMVASEKANTRAWSILTCVGFLRSR